jgi:hypothetical protein
LVAVIAGALIFVLITWNLAVVFNLRKFTIQILKNQTPSLGALIFILMLVVFRGLNDQGSLNEAVASRYVMGTSLLIFGLFVLILEKQNKKFKVRIAFMIICLVLVCSVSGLKTGLEWLSVRSLQTTALRACLENPIVNPVDCLQVAESVEEGGSNDEATNKDLEDLSVYLIEVD